MMGLVIFAAVTCAGLLPVFRGVWKSLPEAVLSEALILAGIWWLFIALFVRVGPFQFWLLRAISLVPVLLGFLMINLCLVVIVRLIPRGNVEFVFYVAVAGIVDALFLVAIYRLGKHLIPLFCPSCRSLTLISDTGTSRPVLRGSKATRWCWSCRKRYGRIAGGKWESVDFQTSFEPIRQTTPNPLK
jgi:hypothetical protein